MKYKNLTGVKKPGPDWIDLVIAAAFLMLPVTFAIGLLCMLVLS